jgi:hypothetical protein
MKRKILILLIICFSALHLKAQDVTQQIKNQFTQYSSLIIDKKFEGALSYMNPDFFKIIPKEQMILLLEKTFSSIDFDYKTGLPTLSDFQPAKLIENKHYIKFTSNSPLQIKFKESKGDAPKTDNEKKLSQTLIKLALEKQYGANNVTYDEPTGYYNIMTHKSVIANSDNKMTDWKFVIVEPAQKNLLSRFIPAELLD